MNDLQHEAATVWTVRGRLPVGELGVTLPHEHLFVLSSEFQRNYPHLWDVDRGVDLAVRELERAYDAGVRTVVDMTVIGQGRDIGLARRVAERTRVNLVVATGVYSVDGLPLFARFRGPGTDLGGDEPLTDLLVRDIVDGIAQSGVRAGLVKFACEASSPPGTAERMAEITAEVSARTGVAVVVHSDPFAGNGLRMAALLVSAGVPPGRVVVSHAGDSPDLAYLRALADTGCLIGYDRYGMTTFAPDEQRNRTLAELVRAGHTAQLLVSQDHASHIDYLTVEQRRQLWPQWGYDHLVRRVFPALLREPGVDEEVILELTVRNPARLLTTGVRTAAAA